MMSRMRAAGAVLAALGFLAGCEGVASNATPGPVAPAGPETAEWTMIEPGGDTLCATGTPFRFHVRAGDPEKVMMFLNGGGACWSGDLCDLSTAPTPYTPFSEMDSNDPRLLQGILGPARGDNPFSGWTQIFVPYCTGDAHLGSRDVTYKTSSGADVIIHHRGKTNVQATLDWLYENHPAPARVFVTGGSAGGIASPYYAGLVAEHYPNANIIQLADGSGGYRAPGIAAVLETWGAFDGLPDWPEFGKIERSSATTEDFFRITAARHPDVQLARFDNVDDSVQQDFLGLLGITGPVRPLVAANNADLARDIPGIATFAAAGDAHTALRYDRVYTEAAEGVRLIDWITQLTDDAAPRSVSCETNAACD